MATIYKRERSPFWQARIVVGGMPNRISTGEHDKRKAQKSADEAEAEANRNIVSSNELRLTGAAERFFLMKTNLSPKTVRNYRSSLAQIKAKLGDFPIRLLDKDRLNHYVETRRIEIAALYLERKQRAEKNESKLPQQRGGSVAIRRDLAFLSSVYATVSPDFNPLIGFSKRNLPQARERTRWLTPAELERIIDACREETHRVFFILLVETGMRPTEVLGLENEWIDLNERQIILWGDRTKNGDYRIVPLTDRVVDTLKHTQLRTGKYLFLNPETGKPFTTFRKAWEGICERANLPDIVIYTLRHTFASWGLQRGIEQLPLQHWMGHKTPSMTRRYAKSSADSLRAAARRFSDNTQSNTQTTDLTARGE